MRAVRARALRSGERPNPGRKRGGAGKVPNDYRELLRWLTENREERALKVDVRALDPDWPDGVDDPTDDDAIWSWSYSIEATDWSRNPSVPRWCRSRRAMTGWRGRSRRRRRGRRRSVTYHGAGLSLDEAAGRVLASMREHHHATTGGNP